MWLVTLVGAQNLALWHYSVIGISSGEKCRIELMVSPSERIKMQTPGIMGKGHAISSRESYPIWEWEEFRMDSRGGRGWCWWLQDKLLWWGLSFISITPPLLSLLSGKEVPGNQREAALGTHIEKYTVQYKQWTVVAQKMHNPDFLPQGV